MATTRVDPHHGCVTILDGSAHVLDRARDLVVAVIDDLLLVNAHEPAADLDRATDDLDIVVNLLRVTAARIRGNQ